MTSRISWYSTNENLRAEDQGAIDLSGALAVVQRYFGQLRSHYSSAEEALSSTMFGFSRGDDDLLELCIHSPSEIAVRIELPPRPGRFLSRLRGGYLFQETVTSQALVEERVRQYFTVPAEDLQGRLAAGRAT